MSGVEIKVNVDGPYVTAALQKFERDGAGTSLAIGFLEDTTVGAELPLLEAGVVVRVRAADDADDVTVKLRPCRRSQLTGDWLEGDAPGGCVFKIEQDWTGSRRVLAASCRVVCPPGLIAAVRDGDEQASRLFTKALRRFVDECASVPVNLNALTPLVGVTAHRWKPVKVKGIKEKVDVERWTLDELDFLELSVKLSSLDNAESTQLRLEDELRLRGVPVSSVRQTKTALVLGRLAALQGGHSVGD